MAVTSAGARLRQRIEHELKESGLELDGRESTLLDRAVGVSDTIEQLELALAEQGLVVTDHHGTRVNSLVTEIRMQSSTLLRLLGALELVPPEADSASARGRRAANARWNGRRQ